MAYVGEPFRHDVFVSYSHGDPDGTGDSRLGRWSRAFARELETELRAYPKFAKDLKVFLDQHHRASQGLDPLLPLTEQLQEDIAGAAILTVLMSPHYLGSKWCAQERDWWCDSQRKLDLAVDGRIAVARIWETSDPWPPALTDPHGEPLLGFWFYDRANASLYPQPYDWPEPGPSSKDPFRKELLTLVGRVGLKLEETRKRLAERRIAREQATKLATGHGQVVYLHGRAEYDKEWDRAADALSSSGLVVLPGEPDPVVNDARRLQALRQLRVEAMSGCDALLLVSAPDARAVEADLVVVGRQDRNSARARSNQFLPCALIDTVGGEIATPKRKVAARSLNVDWIDATRPEWPPAVKQWLIDVAAREAAQ